MKRGIISVITLWTAWSTMIAQPQGYYDAANDKTGEELKAALHDIIDGHTALSYSALWDALVNTDEDPSNADNFVLIYTGRSLLKSEEYPLWNREHVWAKSHGGFDNDPPAGTDLHHIKPSDVSVNGDRGNKDFDYCKEGGTQHSEATACYYTASAWEPGDQVKGDVARMMFYMAVRYEGDVSGEPDLELVDEIPTSGPFFGKLSALLEWHKADPPDDFEKRRNERIYTAYQGNRNPFIDRPGFAELIWSPQPLGDTIAPVIDSISVINESLITVWFSEEVDPSTSLLPVNYQLDNGASIGTVLQHGLDFSAVDLSVQDLHAGTYSLRVSGVSDIEGNQMIPDTILFDFMTVSIQPGIMVSDALYPNPSDGMVFFPPQFVGNVSYLSVFNEAGTLMLSSRTIGSSLDLSFLQDGSYYLMWIHSVSGLACYQMLILNKD